MVKRTSNSLLSAPQIKKIMRSDKGLGRIDNAVPVLISKALELFLQDLCDRTYEITMTQRAKIISSLHLKQCVKSTSEFDFLKEIVGKASDLGGSAASRDDQLVSRTRKLADYEDGEGGEASKRIKLHATGHTNSGVRGRGRGRGRSSRATVGVKFEDYLDMQALMAIVGDDFWNSMEHAEAPLRNFDHNMELDVDGSAARPATTSVVGLNNTAAESHIEMIDEEYPEWPLLEMGPITIDASQLASFNQLLEEHENYDTE